MNSILLGKNRLLHTLKLCSHENLPSPRKPPDLLTSGRFVVLLFALPRFRLHTHDGKKFSPPEDRPSDPEPQCRLPLVRNLRLLAGRSLTLTQNKMTSTAKKLVKA